MSKVKAEQTPLGHRNRRGKERPAAGRAPTSASISNPNYREETTVGGVDGSTETGVREEMKWLDIQITEDSQQLGRMDGITEGKYDPT